MFYNNFIKILTIFFTVLIVAISTFAHFANNMLNFDLVGICLITLGFQQASLAYNSYKLNRIIAEIILLSISTTILLFNGFTILLN